MSREYHASYDAKTDPQFQKPYIDIDEWRETSVRYHYIHGGFEGTEARFSFFFPEKEKYQGRFYQFMPPVQGSEDASIPLEGKEDKIAFAITHGAYFVESNMGVAIPFAPIADPTIVYRASAAVAEYSRTVAERLYGPHRAYGYIFGGSGGGYKTMSCVENTNAWDGAVPFVIGTPTSIPNNFTVRAHAKRVLRHRLPMIADAMEPGGSGNPYEGLNEEEAAALREITRFGFPLRDWFMYENMDDGALPVLKPLVDAADSSYYEDFWTLPGYLGSDPEGSAVKDRIHYETEVVRIHVPGRTEKGCADTGRTGVDEAWQRLGGQNEMLGKPWIELKSIPEGDLYFYETQLSFLSGEAEGFAVPLEAMEDGIVIVGAGFGIVNMAEMLEKVRPGDKVLLDNSNYIALQTYHRHQVPEPGVGPEEWNQFRDEGGRPVYPQRRTSFGPQMSFGGCGSIQSGRFGCKMIVPVSIMDESAFASQADWYRKKVKEMNDGNADDKFRMWLTDRALHGDNGESPSRLHTVSYLGTLYQALLDVAGWAEKGIAPAHSTVFAAVDGQVEVPEDADERKGIQPVVTLKVMGQKCAGIKTGEAVQFRAFVKVPQGAGKVTGVEWSFEGEQDFPYKGDFCRTERGGEIAEAEAVHIFTEPGTYFPTVRVSANRNGDPDDYFCQVMNLDRVRVIVE